LSKLPPDRMQVLNRAVTGALALLLADRLLRTKLRPLLGTRRACDPRRVLAQRGEDLFDGSLTRRKPPPR